MTERLFFALWPGEEQRRAIERVQLESGSSRGRMVHPLDLHITLVFLGDLDQEQRACAEAAADRVDGEPFRLVLDRVGSFHRARVTWCGPSRSPAALLNLVGALQRELLGCGFPPERRPYAAHATLARKARPIEMREIERPIHWRIEAFALVTTLPGAPPHYRVLRSWGLAQGGQRSL